MLSQVRDRIAPLLLSKRLAVVNADGAETASLCHQRVFDIVENNVGAKQIIEANKYEFLPVTIGDRGVISDIDAPLELTAHSGLHRQSH